ncbi:hypothetical protein KSU16_25250 [Escherichia coli]|nr:hypothetical protein [Escherichia coli]MCU6345295.1 hypothetical protein [Escherichia coli]
MTTGLVPPVTALYLQRRFLFRVDFPWMCFKNNRAYLLHLQPANVSAV